MCGLTQSTLSMNKIKFNCFAITTKRKGVYDFNCNICSERRHKKSCIRLVFLLQHLCHPINLAAREQKDAATVR